MMKYKSQLVTSLLVALAFFLGLALGKLPSDSEQLRSAPALSSAEARRKAINRSPVSLSDADITPALLLLLKDPDHLVRVGAVTYLINRNGNEIPRHEGIHGDPRVQGLGGTSEAWDDYADILHDWLFRKHEEAIGRGKEHVEQSHGDGSLKVAPQE